jgi:hypothetical protein
MNIAEILKDAAKGIPLYSTVLGHCMLEGIINDSEGRTTIWVFDQNGNRDSFESDGRYFPHLKTSECTLFPSKECRDWSNFKLPYPIDKIFMCNYWEDPLNRWEVEYYAGDGKLANTSGPDKTKTTPLPFNYWKYVIPLEDFNFEDIPSCLDKSII